MEPCLFIEWTLFRIVNLVNLPLHIDVCESQVLKLVVVSRQGAPCLYPPAANVEILFVWEANITPLSHLVVVYAARNRRMQARSTLRRRLCKAGLADCVGQA